jgi:hypothetical protein
LLEASRGVHVQLLSIFWNCKARREAALSHFLAGMMDRHPSLRDDPMMRGLA